MSVIIGIWGATYDDEPGVVEAVQEDKFPYPWHEAPEWAQYCTTSASGVRMAWENKPHAVEGGIWWATGLAFRLPFVAGCSPCHNWRNSLRARPAETLTAVEHLDDVTTERNQLAAEVERLTKRVNEYQQQCEEMRAGRSLDVETLTGERDAARAEVERLRSAAAIDAENLRSWMDAEEAVRKEHNEALAEVDRLLAELAKLREQKPHPIAAAAMECFEGVKDCSRYGSNSSPVCVDGRRFVVEVSRSNKPPAEVVWACPKAWATGWRIVVDCACLDVMGTSYTVTLGYDDLRMLYGCNLPPQDGTYEIREPGRAVLIK